MTIRILVIDDHPMVRAGVRAELENSGADLEVVGDASDVEGAIAACRALTPDVALLDVHLPGGNGGGGAEVASSCRDIEGLHFLALSVSDAAEDVVQVIRARVRHQVDLHPGPRRGHRTRRRGGRRLQPAPGRLRPGCLRDR